MTALYTIENRVEFDRSPLQVDGVEIITRREREAIEARIQRLQQHIQSEIERAILYGDGPSPVALPKPTT